MNPDFSAAMALLGVVFGACCGYAVGKAQFQNPPYAIRKANGMVKYYEYLKDCQSETYLGTCTRSDEYEENK